MDSALPDSGFSPRPTDSGTGVIGTTWADLDPEVIPDLDKLVTEDDTPVDNMFAEKEQRLLTEPLYSSWAGPDEGKLFLALANVGWFHTYREPPMVPDAILSVDVKPAGDLLSKEGRSYFQWLLGKPPDVVIEIVSDRRGGEEGHKKRICARQLVAYYVIFDPKDFLGGGVLRAFALDLASRQYQPIDPAFFPGVGLGLTLWTGTFEGQQETWLRWCDREGRPIPTGAERASAEAGRADEERRRADEERRRADDEQRRADAATANLERLAAQLRALGVEPENGPAAKPQ